MLKTIFLIVLFCGPVFGDHAPARRVDGKVQFATCSVNGVNAWTVAEKDALIAATTGGATVDYFTEDADEVNLATCTAGYYFGDLSRIKNKAEIFKAAKQMKLEADTYTELGVAIPVDLRNRLRWLKHYYGTLP